ncbi:hypothetical protein NQ318_020214 [Aromia moschata]|uniref:Uncharacterized protein n=1 Tax=Aromia moschata TaxID=1265417 RepID=A0AAV8ZC64_9CUCU|nr:hypothetical protein NQ318_020214 [Aromia moschata]
MKLTTEDLNPVGEKYVSSLFDQRKSKTVVITHPSKLVEVDDGFKELGFDFMVYPSVEESFLNTL